MLKVKTLADLHAGLENGQIDTDLLGSVVAKVGASETRQNELVACLESLGIGFV